MKTIAAPLAALVLAAAVAPGAAGAAEAAAAPARFETSPGDVVELAPGVWFHHGDLVGKGHCNNGFVVFRDFVLAIDGNFPSGAEACLAAIRKVTDRPVRFVFDTHHHGDHAYGNAVWMKAGAIPIACGATAEALGRYEPGRWRSAGRPDVAALGDAPMPPVITFTDRLVLDDGTQRVELFRLGAAHTTGDGFAWVPARKVLFTGDVVLDGPWNYLGDGDTASWLKTIDDLKPLGAEVIAGGHGRPGDGSLLDRQRAFLVELRAGVAAGVAGGKTAEEIVGTILFPDAVKPYVGDFLPDQVKKVRDEIAGAGERK